MNLKRQRSHLAGLQTVLETEMDEDKLSKLSIVVDSASDSWAARREALYQARAIELRYRQSESEN